MIEIDGGERETRSHEPNRTHRSRRRRPQLGPGRAREGSGRPRSRSRSNRTPPARQDPAEPPAAYLECIDGSRVAAIPLFADLPEDELAAVASVASEIEIGSGQALAAEGRIGHSLFAIESGTAEVVVEGATLRTIGAGDVVGELAVLASPPDPFAAAELAEGGLRTASVVATSPMRLIGLFKRDVWALDRRAPLATQRLRALLDEHRAQDAQRAASEQRAQNKQTG